MLKVKQIRIFIVIIIKLKAFKKIELSKSVLAFLGSFLGIVKLEICRTRKEGALWKKLFLHAY